MDVQRANQNYSWKQKYVDESAWFREISDSVNLRYYHQQKDFDDFNIQTLLPHKLSQYGPQMAVLDINNDGLQDLIIGGSPAQAADY
jgi:hypothetical protein